MIWPSSTTTFDSIERLLVDGPAFDVPGATCCDRLDASWKIVMRIVPFSPICGWMRSVMPTSLRSIVWNGLVVAPPVLRELAGHERHVAADDDLRFLVVERDQVRRRRDVGVGLALQDAGDRGQGEGAEEVVDQADVEALAEQSGDAVRRRAIARAGRGGAGSAPSCAAVMASRLPAVPKFVPPTSALLLAAARDQALPLEAEVGGVVAGRPRRSGSRCRPARAARRAGRSSRAPGGRAARAR